MNSSCQYCTSWFIEGVLVAPATFYLDQLPLPPNSSSLPSNLTMGTCLLCCHAMLQRHVMLRLAQAVRAAC